MFACFVILFCFCRLYLDVLLETFLISIILILFIWYIHCFNLATLTWILCILLFRCICFFFVFFFIFCLQFLFCITTTIIIILCVKNVQVAVYYWLVTKKNCDSSIFGQTLMVRVLTICCDLLACQTDDLTFSDKTWNSWKCWDRCLLTLYECFQHFARL